ncbi:heme-binding protein 1-like isoform X3 [Gopherus evgoodei]|uniref:heme-binding protein 1-like isoform X3 n=1 Tax=Gopherus evgoodei TaxID=1825980 RepID=UPI0011D0002A|nr:heme-binding protein 1-like isoform X3 [Gopherus evgoodei]
MRLQSPLRSGWGSALQRRGEGYSRGGQPSAIARARQFGGYAKEEDYVNYAAKLRSALGSEAAYRKDFYLCNGYDPPMKPYWRCNEVWFVME